MPRPGDCFEAFQLQFFFALHARSELVVLDSQERFVNQLQHGAVGIGLAEQKFLGVRVGSLVGEIDGRIIVSGPPFFFGPRNAFQQFLAPGYQFFLVVFESFLIHGSWPRGSLYRRYYKRVIVGLLWITVKNGSGEVFAGANCNLLAGLARVRAVFARAFCLGLIFPRASLDFTGLHT
jgi:hypothetical protein